MFMPDKDINIYGFNPVLEALEKEIPLRAVFIKRGKLGLKARKIINLCNEKNIPVIFKEPFFFKKENRIYWILAQGSPVEFKSEEEFLKEPGEPIILLYKIQDPQNLGNLFRTISALGFSKVALTVEDTAPISEVVSRASEGAINFLNFSNIKKPLNFLKMARERGFKIYGATMEGVPAWKIEFEKNLVLILGSEGKGIPEPYKKLCDNLISIPLKGPVKSLNVSTAGGIILYEIGRKLFPSSF